MTPIDADVLRSIGPSNFNAYLRASGWTNLEPHEEDRFFFWERESNGEVHEVLIPKEQRWRDYARRLSEAVSVLASVERRSEMEIIAEILRGGVQWPGSELRTTRTVELP